MKLLLGSDLHLEFKKQQALPELPDYDVAILAGDIGNGVKGFEFAQEFFPADKPVLYIPGNHEYYGHDIKELDDQLIQLATDSKNVHLINGGCTTIDGVKFIGTTLWTDFKLNGYVDYPLNQYAAAISDFTLTTCLGEPFHPAHARIIFEEYSEYIVDELEKNKEGKNVVVTHFMPSQECITKYWQGNGLNPYFCNDLDYIINEFEPDLWLYGHTHDKGDKVHSNGKTRLVSNPRGYPKEKKDYFKWKILEI